ncbi:MAG: DUF433 domain-containing protein [Bacteroidetes bacterium]|nr:MAG: DUF433 domain-containing protein [Bacteroidota bacterium]
MRPEDVISMDPGTLNGTPVFVGTRVPVETLFDHLERGISIADFLDDFPTVTKEQAIAILEMAGKVLSSQKFPQVYEAAVG